MANRSSPSGPRGPFHNAPVFPGPGEQGTKSKVSQVNPFDIQLLPALTEHDVILETSSIDIINPCTLFIAIGKDIKMGPLTSKKIELLDISINHNHLDFKITEMIKGSIAHIRLIKLLKHGVKQLLVSAEFSFEESIKGKIPIIYCEDGKLTKETGTAGSSCKDIHFTFKFKDIYPLIMENGLIDFDCYPDLWKVELLTRFQYMIEQLGLEVYG